MRKIVLLWAWLHALVIIYFLPAEHPWKEMTFDEYVKTADMSRYEFAIQLWLIPILVLFCLTT